MLTPPIRRNINQDLMASRGCEVANRIAFPDLKLTGVYCRGRRYLSILRDDLQKPHAFCCMGGCLLLPCSRLLFSDIFNNENGRKKIIFRCMTSVQPHIAAVERILRIGVAWRYHTVYARDASMGRDGEVCFVFKLGSLVVVLCLQPG